MTGKTALIADYLPNRKIVDTSLETDLLTAPDTPQQPQDDETGERHVVKD